MSFFCVADLRIRLMSSFYAVHNGRKRGVYQSWDQVQPLVTGYRDAVYKKFKTHAQAQHFVETGEVKRADNPHIQLQDNGELYVYTDGSYNTKTKRSGYGVAWDPPFTHYADAHQLPNGTSNQRAELEAIYAALCIIDKTPEIKDVVVANKAVAWTDSDYACRCLGDYIHKWKENGWVTGSGQPVKHKQLLQDLDRLLTKLRHVKLRHISEVGLSSHDSAASVRGAAAITQRVWAGNKRADELATGS